MVYIVLKTNESSQKGTNCPLRADIKHIFLNLRKSIQHNWDIFQNRVVFLPYGDFISIGQSWNGAVSFICLFRCDMSVGGSVGQWVIITIATPSFATLFIFEICFNGGALFGLRDDLNEKFHPLGWRMGWPGARYIQQKY